MDIGIQYISGLVSDVSIQEIELIAKENGLELKTRDLSTQVFASADTAVFFIMVSPILLQSISDGLISSATYDAIKLIAKKLADQISGQSYSKVRSKEIESKVAKFYLKTQSSTLKIELPANDKEAIEKALNKLVKAHVKLSNKDS